MHAPADARRFVRRVALPAALTALGAGALAGCATPSATPPRERSPSTARTTLLDPPPAPAAAPASAAAAARARAAAAIEAEEFDAATVAADEALALDADDADALLLRGRAERLAGAALAAAGNGTAAQLRQFDARRALERAAALRPRDVAVLRELGLAHRDAWDFAAAAETLRRARAVEAEDRRPHDPELACDLAHALGYGGDFAAALPLFREAEAALGPEPRIVLNIATCMERLGDREGAVAALRAHYAAECAAGRGGGDDARRALEKVWEITVMRRDYAAGERALLAIADAHPDAAAPPYMLGNLREFRGDLKGAAGAWARALAVADLPVARVKRALALSRAGERAAAVDAAHDVVARARDADGASDAVAAVAAEALRGGAATEAAGLLAAAIAVWPDATDLLLLAGEAALARGDAAAAHASFTAACEASPFATSPPARRARTALALRRAGAPPPGEAPPPAAAAAPSAPGPVDEMLLGFDEPAIFVRSEAARPRGTARIDAGALVLPATEAPPPREEAARRGGWWRGADADGAALRVDFLPDLDLARYATVRFRARAESGEARLRVRILDAYDEMGSGFTRSRWPGEGEGVPVTTEARDVECPVAEITGFVPARAIPPHLGRVRALLVAVEAAADGTSPAVRIDDLVLVPPVGSSLPSLVLATFDEAPSEVVLRYDGGCVPFARTLATPEDAAAFVAPGTTPVTRAILGDAFDPALVGGGTGALRLHHGESVLAPPVPRRADGGGPGGGAGAPGTPAAAAPPGEGTLSSTATFLLNPDRDVLRFRAITFLARGAKGGERLRVRIEDALDHERAAYLPAARGVAAVFPRTPEADGALVLEAGWHRYRIPLAAYPDVDFAALGALVFEFGDDVGNARGTVILLDDLGLER